jgi:hypothetical protein
MSSPNVPAAGPVVGSRSIVSAVVRFTAAQGVLVAVLAYVLSSFVWTDAASQHAITISAWVAFAVQILTFSICKLVAQTNVIAGWGMGALLRFATVAVWALLGVKALGLTPTAALLSLLIFFFVSTLIEPLFLNS